MPERLNLRLPSWRAVGMLAVVLAVAAYLVLVPGRSDDTAGPPVGQGHGNGSASLQQSGETREPDASAGKPLVERMLNQLRAGRRVVPQTDNPIKGASVKVVPAARGRILELGRLRIPAIGLDTLYREGVHSEALVDGPGHWPGTPYPGQRGNAVLSGHRTGWTQPFYRLDALQRGDAVKVTFGGDADTYRVTSTTILSERTYVRHVLQQPAKPNQRLLTMFACNPIGSQRQRIVVQARASALPVDEGGR